MILPSQVWVNYLSIWPWKLLWSSHHQFLNLMICMGLVYWSAKEQNKIFKHWELVYWISATEWSSWFKISSSWVLLPKAKLKWMKNMIIFKIMVEALKHSLFKNFTKNRQNWYRPIVIFVFLEPFFKVLDKTRSVRQDLYFKVLLPSMVLYCGALATTLPYFILWNGSIAGLRDF